MVTQPVAGPGRDGGGRPTTIRSLATYVPPRVLTNADLEKMVDTTDEWIMQRIGIRERHIVDPGRRHLGPRQGSGAAWRSSAPG